MRTERKGCILNLPSAASEANESESTAGAAIDVNGIAYMTKPNLDKGTFKTGNHNVCKPTIPSNGITGSSSNLVHDMAQKRPLYD